MGRELKNRRPQRALPQRRQPLGDDLLPGGGNVKLAARFAGAIVQRQRFRLDRKEPLRRRRHVTSQRRLLQTLARQRQRTLQHQLRRESDAQGIALRQLLSQHAQRRLQFRRRLQHAVS